jgi:transposase
MEDRVERRYVGIDVSKQSLVVAVSDEAAQRTFGNEAGGHRQLVQWLTRRGRRARVCLEATGIYHLDVALMLHRTPGIELSVVNPAASAHFAGVLIRRAKTDGVDAALLQTYAERMPFVAWQPPHPVALELRAIVRRMGALIEARTQEKNRLHAAEHTAALATAVAEDITEHLAQLEARIEKLQQQALTVLASDVELKELFALICTVPGFATRSALRTLAELAVLPADMTVRQKVAHAGLDPRPRESGSSVHKPTRISKTGNPHLRAALYMPALVAVQHDPHVAAFYQQRLAGGLKPIAALVAVERKLLHTLHGIAKHRTPFHGAKFRALPT